mgnify:CR=1 FL=1
MLITTLFLLACGPDPNAPPPRPDGEFRVVAVHTSEATIPGPDAILGGYPGCIWGQQSFTFTKDRVATEISVLCPSDKENALACQVNVRGEAFWDAEGGRFVVPNRAKGTGAFVSHNEEEPPKDLAGCEVVLAKGEYPVARIYNGQWKWEVRTPDGSVHRLVAAEARPDFVGAMLAQQEEKK